MSAAKSVVRTMMDAPALTDPLRRIGAVAFAIARAPDADRADMRFDAEATNRVRPGHGRSVGDLALAASLRWTQIAETQAARLEGEPGRMRIAEAASAMTRSIQHELPRLSREQASFVAAAILSAAARASAKVSETTLDRLDTFCDGLRGKSPEAEALSRLLAEHAPLPERPPAPEFEGPAPR